MQESGVFDKLKSAAYPSKQLCNEMSAIESLGLNMVYTIFVLLGLAIVLSFLLLLCEHLGHRLEKKWRNFSRNQRQTAFTQERRVSI